MSTPRPVVLALTLSMAAAASAVAVSSSNVSAADGSVFINEIHYDNAGGDVGEFIEIAGPAGTDLTGWSLVLYNGNGGASYATIDLTGVVIDDEGSGAGAVDVSSTGLQNGAPDGIALASPSELIEFLSYEGSFTGVGGVADGVVSTDVGVTETGSDAPGSSLQRTGTGSLSSDFAWAGPVAESPGSINSGQTFTGGPTGPLDPVINELGISDASTDDEFAEFVGAADTDYSAYALVEIEGDNSTGVINSVVPLGTTDASGRYTIDPAPSFQNGTTTFLLVDGFTGASGDDLDGDDDGVLDVEPWARIVDEIAITDGDPGDLTYGLPVLDESFDDARLTNGFAPGGISRIPDGTDTDSASDWYRNDFDWDGSVNGTPEQGEALNTPGAPNEIVAAPAPTLFISELHYDNVSTDEGEFIEITGPAGTDLTDWSLVLYNGNNGAPYGTTPLFGVIDDESAGQGALSFLIEGIQNGAPDGIALVGPAGLVEFLSYEGSFTAVGGPADGATSVDIGVSEPGSTPVGESLQLIDDEWVGPLPASPGDLNAPGDGPDGAELVECATEPTLTLISAVQGAGATSPLATGSPVFTEGETVTIEGIVTVLSEGLDGFFVNEEDGDVDGDPLTSEGVYVYVPSLLGSISQGDTVQVTGAVTEDFGLTQIGSQGNGEVDSVAICDPVGTVTPTPLPLPLTPSEREPYESMFVLASDLVVSGTFDDFQFGELVTGYQGELPQVSDDADPGSPEALALAEANAAAELRLDDRDDDVVFGRSLWSSVDSRRTGDMVSATGALDWSFGRWKLQYDVLPTFTERGLDPLPTLPGGTDVVSFNVLNYFNTFGDSDVLRGARSAEEFEIQSDKIVAAITQMDAAVVGLVEIENDYEDEYDGDPTTVPSAQTLVDRLNTVVGDGTYDWIRIPESLLTGTGLGNGGLGTDAIAVGLIYQPERATPIGEATTFDIDADYGGDSENNRWPLAQTFDVDGEVFTAVVNHFKSKGSTCADTSSTGNPTFALGDDDGSTEAGNCDLTRQVAANALVDWLAGDPTGSGDADVLLLGDYNSYAEETPIDIIEAAGYTDLVDEQADDAFTYIFSGRVGRLDYAFSSPTLTPKILGTDVWQINSRAQYSDIYFRDPIDTTGPEGSSDHDPVLVALNGLPTVDAGGPYEVRVGNRTIELTAVGTDPDGDALTYAWDLDGDGEFDDATGAVAEFSSKRLRPGTYDVSVMVTDAAGETAIDDTTVEVVTPRRSLLRRVFEIIRWILTTVGGHR